MKISICDDDACDLLLVHECLREYDATLDITHFPSAQALMTAFSHTFYDLIFLDIEMAEGEKLNGFEAARLLMERDRKPLIIFTTNSHAYSVYGYGLAFRYLVKPLEYQLFSEVLTLALDELTPQQVSFYIENTSKIFSVSEIIFFEVYGHELVVHMLTGTIHIRESLSSVMCLLAAAPFAQPHKSYFINLSFVREVSNNHILMSTGQRVYLSRSKRAAFQTALLRHLRR